MRALLCALLVCQALALPLAGDELGEPQTMMFDAGDDEATLTAELNKAIGHVQMGMDPKDLGDSADVEDDATSTDWGKKAANEIDNMSKSEMAEIGNAAGLTGNDKLIAQFKSDVQAAKARAAKPAKMKAKKSDIEMAADKALLDPAERKKLKAEGEKAEMDYSTMIPSAMSLLQEDPSDDFSEDLGEGGMALMSGDDTDVAKAINDQINGQVSNQLGKIPTESGDVNVLEQFEQDQQQASEFLMTKKRR